MKRPLRHIIKDFISSLNLTFKVNSAIIVGDNTVLTVDNILHLRAGLIVTIAGNQYEVYSVSNATVFTIIGKPTNPTSVIYPTPYFFVGTLESVGQELTTRKSSDDKYPFIYLYEVIEEQFSLLQSESIERTADVRLFFLDETTSKWDETFNLEEYYQKVIDGQFRLAHYFIEQANLKSKYFSRMDNYRVRSTHKYDLFDDLRSKLNEKLAGTHVRVTLNVNKENNC